MSDYISVFIYALLVFGVTLATLAASALFTGKSSTLTKYLPYESGIQTETHLQQQRFPLRHYLVALIFLVFDIEIIFLFPWAVVGKEIGVFAFYEMLFFLVILLVGFSYVWKKGGLEWE